MNTTENKMMDSILEERYKAYMNSLSNEPYKRKGNYEKIEVGKGLFVQFNDKNVVAVVNNVEVYDVTSKEVFSINSLIKYVTTAIMQLCYDVNSFKQWIDTNAGLLADRLDKFAV